MKLLIKNINRLAFRHTSVKMLSGKEMAELPLLENAWLSADDGVISGYGEMKDFGGISDWSDLTVIDAGGKCVLPCWCDSHTHLVFASTREKEFVDRINGLSYQEIAERGGGILNSAEKIAAISEQDLFDISMKRLDEVIRLGTGAIEIKSGYGLTLESELKMLRVIARIKSKAPLPVKSTFLGAHAVPKGKTREAYIREIIDEMLPNIAKEKLADYCDVFCEKSYFNEEETVRILECAARFGIKAKVHAEQLSHSGGIRAGVKVSAISVDHLEYISDEDIQLLMKSETMPVILPGAQWFLQLPHPPVRKMIASGLPVAIATDYNPGSCPSGNMNFMLSIACVQYKMTPAEAINAATINGAHAMELSERFGSLGIGKVANLIITKEIPSFDNLPYAFANDLIDSVLLNGRVYQ